MGETPHLVAHFMAAGAEKRLEDYHFLRNTYETITGQEIQLNRILRLLDEDEISLNWRLDLSPIGRARSRSVYEFDRWNNAAVLKGNIAYERLRELEQETFKHTREPTYPSSSRRVQEIRDRRQRLSEQRECPPSSTFGGGSGTSSSSSRLRALAEYDTALAESETKRQRQVEENRKRQGEENRQRQVEENRLNTLKNEEKELTERRREKFKTTFDDENQKYGKSKQQEDEPSNRLTKTARSNEDRYENDADRIRKSSIKYDPDKSGDIELISFTVRSETIPLSKKQQGEENSSVRLLCQWASPSSSSAIDYFTIERQFGDEEWLPVGKKIDKLENQTQLDISSLKDADHGMNANIPSCFRLKAHLRNGQTVASKPTDEIFINLSREKKIVVPDVEILSPNSVQLTWEDNENDDNNNNNEEKSNIYDIEKKEEEQPEWEKVIEVPLSQHSARIDSLTDAKQCQFRLIPSVSEPEEITRTGNQVEPEVLTVNNVNEWLNSLHIVPTSPTTVDVDISKEGFKEYECYKIEYTTINKLSEWKQMSNITRDDPHLTIDNLQQGTEYKFRFTPILSGTTITTNETNPSQFSLILDVKMPSKRRGRFTGNESTSPIATSPQFSNAEVFAENQTASPSATPSKLALQEVSDENESATPIAASPQFSKVDKNKSETPVAKSSKNSFQNDVDENETASPTATSPQFSFKTKVDEDENESETPIATSPQISFKTKADQNKSETSVAKSSKNSFQNGVDENETASPTAASPQFSFKTKVDEEENESETPIAASPQFSFKTKVDDNENVTPTATSPQFSFKTKVDEDENESETSTATSPQFSSKQKVNQHESKSPVAKSSQDVDGNETASSTAASPQFSFKQNVDENESETPVSTSPRFSFRNDADENENETPVSTPLQFSIQKRDSTSVLIEAVVPEEEPATFEDVYDIYSKNETIDDDDWTKVGTIDKDHLSTTVENLEENTAYAFKIDNITAPAADNQSHTIQELKFDTTPVKQYDPSLFLEKIEESLENIVNGVMQAAAGHQILEEPVNKSLNEVIREAFRDEALLPNEQYGFDTLALNTDLQVYRGPKQMMLNELEIDENVDLSKDYGEIIIHNYRTSHQSVIVREENGNTRVANIDGDIIIRNVVSDVLLKNEQTHHQLSMNIVGQAFLKGVQGTLIASKFRGIIVVKNVNKP